MKKVLVTGAHGFVGRNAALAFKKKGYRVIGIGLGKWIEEDHRDFGIDEWNESSVSFEALKGIKQIDTIIHCAGSGSVGYSLTHPLEDFQMTIDCTAGVLEYMRIYCPHARLIYPSSAAVYGAAEDRPIRETDILNPVAPYGYYKKIAEILCESYSKNFSLNISIIRFFSLYGRGLKKQLLWDACNKFASGNAEIIFYGTGNETRDWIHINDAVSLIYEVSQSSNKFEILNGGSGRRVTIKEILDFMAQVFGKKQEAVFNKETRHGDPKYYHADMTTAFKLNWRPVTSLEEGVKEYVEWFMDSVRK